MTKKEFFNKILEVTADVCSVSKEDIMNGCRKEDVCGARSILVFWCDAAGFTCLSLLTCTGRSGSNSIKSILASVEEYWKTRFAYHIFLQEVGKRLLNIASEINEEFDLEKVINRIRKSTGKY